MIFNFIWNLWAGTSHVGHSVTWACLVSLFSQKLFLRYYEMSNSNLWCKTWRYQSKVDSKLISIQKNNRASVDSVFNLTCFTLDVVSCHHNQPIWHFKLLMAQTSWTLFIFKSFSELYICKHRADCIADWLTHTW